MEVEGTVLVEQVSSRDFQWGEVHIRLWCNLMLWKFLEPNKEWVCLVSWLSGIAQHWPLIFASAHRGVYSLWPQVWKLQDFVSILEVKIKQCFLTWLYSKLVLSIFLFCCTKMSIPQGLQIRNFHYFFHLLQECLDGHTLLPWYFCHPLTFRNTLKPWRFLSNERDFKLIILSFQSTWDLVPPCSICEGKAGGCRL